jgi:putrescine transport system permease protein
MNARRLENLALVIGLGFLWVPILILMVYSFNASKLVTVWAGFSTKWYLALFRDRQLIEAAWLSLRVAVASASTALVLGTMAAIALTRYGPFRGRTLFGALLTAPLVMPEIITGLSLLLLFVAMSPLVSRGMLTLWIAHTTFATAYVTVVVATRLAEFDRSLEEAALDLGATPLRVFRDVTLPVIAPALLSAWLLAFTLSVDDLVISSFVTGPGSSTLPIVIFSSVRLGVSPKVNALATLLVLVIVAGALFSWLAMRRASARYAAVTARG